MASMRNFTDQFENNVRMFPNKAALISDYEGSLTYDALDNESGKVFAYLKEKGIGREDVVYIHMTRGLGIIVAMIGVLKAGACFCVSEDNMPSDMCDFIAKDCGAALTIDDSLFAQILKGNTLKGHTDSDEHDAAYIVYTSGTTDEPKGVLHEYGNLLQAVCSHYYDGKSLIGSEDIFALLSPLNFVAAVMDTIIMLYHGGGIFLADRDITRNPNKVMERCAFHKITCLFMVPSLVKLVKDAPGTIRFFIVGGEPADGDFSTGTDVYNFLAMSETGFGICVKKCEAGSNYNIIGRTQFDLDIRLLDENGCEVPKGTIGELCFDNKYVRGYINLPGENERAFRNGIFHTGDMAVLEADGQYRLCGRRDNMLKINGNRVDPAEVEIISRRVLKVKDLAVKGFNKDGRAILCLYYTADEELNISNTREILLEYLPYYMIPSFFIRLDAFLLNSNGKKDRKVLDLPNIEDYRSIFCAPGNETEAKICRAFEEVFNIDRVGIFDDFLLLGGDSVSAYRVIVICKLPHLTVQDIFKGHTPYKIAKMAEDKTERDSERLILQGGIDVLDNYPLSCKQLEMLDIQLVSPLSSMWILSSLDKLKEDVDADRFIRAVDKVLCHHPVFSTEFINDSDGDFAQHLNPAILRKTEVINISDSEFEPKKSSLIRPFDKYFNVPLYYTCIYKTETSVYFQWAIHHMIFDGTSLKLLRQHIFDCYTDEGIQLPPDYYYLTLPKVQNEILKKPSDIIYTPPAPFVHSADNVAGECEFKLDISDKLRSTMKAAVKYGVNVCLMASAAMALCGMTESDNACFKWVYNGRDAVYKLNVIGTLYKTLSVNINLSGLMSLDELLKRTKEEIGHSILRGPVDAGSEADDDCALCLLFQDNIYDPGDYSNLIDTSEKLEGNDEEAYTPFDFEIYIMNDEYNVSVHYNKSIFPPKTVSDYCSRFKKCVSYVMSPDVNLLKTIDTIL